MNLDDCPDLMTVAEVQQVFRIGRRQIYEAIRRGEIPHLRIGRTVRVPKIGLRRLLEGTGPPAWRDPGRHPRVTDRRRPRQAGLRSP